MRCWVPDDRLREFVEAVVRLAGIDRSVPGCRPPHGAVWLDGDRPEERCWDHIQGLLARTGTLTRTWMGFCWESRSESGEGDSQADGQLFPWERPGVVRCELQRDDGYDGVNVRLDVAPELVEQVRRAAVVVGGGAGQA